MKENGGTAVIVGKALCPENDGALHMFAMFLLCVERFISLHSSCMKSLHKPLFYAFNLQRTPSAHAFTASLHRTLYRTPSPQAFTARLHRTPSPHAFKKHIE